MVAIEITKDWNCWRLGRKHEVNEGVAVELIKRGVAKYGDGSKQSNASDGTSDRADNTDASKKAIGAKQRNDSRRSG